MPRMSRALLAALGVVALAAVTGRADDGHKKADPAPTAVTITKVDAKSGEITVSYPGDGGKSREKTFRLTRDVRVLDETGRVLDVAMFESGNTALVIESEGRVKELRRMPSAAGARRLADSVRTHLELAEYDDACAEDLQRCYDMLRKLDTGKDGKLDPKAIKAAATEILEDRVKTVFQRLDADKNGKISKDEARGLIKEHFDHIDANKDGVIELDELMKAAKEHHERKATEARTSDREPAAKERK